jgi:pyruvate-formate lyase-activating enzyme
LDDPFPSFWCQSPEVNDALPPNPYVRIRYWSTGGWTVQDDRNRVLFSFDLPPTLFSVYAEDGELTRVAAANMKETVFAELQAVVFSGAEPRVIQFRLEPEWLENLRRYALSEAELESALAER